MEANQKFTILVEYLKRPQNLCMFRIFSVNSNESEESSGYYLKMDWYLHTFEDNFPLAFKLSSSAFTR